jgi:predicted kinase
MPIANLLWHDQVVVMAVPDPALILLVGPSGSGKSTFAARHFRPTEIVSSDECRSLLSNDDANQEATPDAFELLRLILRKRLQRKLSTVVDATNLRKSARDRLTWIAYQLNIPVVGIIFQLPIHLFQERNLQRAGRVVAPDVLLDQFEELNKTLALLRQEDFAQLYIFKDTEQIRNATIVRQQQQSSAQADVFPTPKPLSQTKE